MDMTLADLQKIANETAHSKGWYDDGERNIGEVIALMHSELSEALEEWRSGVALDEIRYDGEDNKPEGFPIELADAIIRIADTCEERNIDLTQAVLEKLAYNRTRSYRHGGKKA